MKAVAYCRFSSDNQREESIDAQMRAIRSFCEDHGHVLTHAYIDRAESATSDDRVQFQHMISDARRGMFELVIVHKFNRFARSRIDSAINKKILRDHDIDLISVTQPLNDNPESVLLESLLEGIDEYYSLNLGIEVAKGHSENAHQCKHNGGRPPLGYDLDNDLKYIINEREAEAVRLIFGMYTEGRTYGEIINELKIHGHVSKIGRSIGKNALHDILKNEKYTGIYIYNRSASKNKKGTRNNHAAKSDDKIIRIEGGIPEIIPRDMFNAVARRMKDRAMPGKVFAKEIYPLSGIVKCGHCGGSMNGQNCTTVKSKTHYRYYSCARKHTYGKDACIASRISGRILEAQVLAHVQKHILDPKALERSLKHAEGFMQTNAFETEKKSLEKNLRALDGKINNIADAIENGMFHESMIRRITELEEEKAQLQRRISDVESEAANAILDIDRIRRTARELSDLDLTPLNLKKIFAALVKKVTVFPDRVEIKTLIG